MANKVLVLIDPGHGGLDENCNYVTAPDKMYDWGNGEVIHEGVWNREIADRLMEILECEPNVDYRMIPDRVNDTALYVRTGNANNIASVKKNDYDLIFYLSIHANAGGGRGARVYVHPDASEWSKDLADMYGEAWNDVINDFEFESYSPDQSWRPAEYYVLENTSIPAILTENLFMDTYENYKYMTSEEGKDRIAKVHADIVRKAKAEL